MVARRVKDDAAWRLAGAGLALWGALVLGGCPEEPPAADATVDAGPTVDGEAKVELKPGQICLQGEVQACIDQGGKRALICNASQTAFIEGECTGIDGSPSLCIDNQCTQCFPNDQVCEGDDRVVRCAADGSGYALYQDCLADTGGDVCFNGECQSLCAINIKFNSYIGCDYWGVDLDNAFVPGGRAGYYDAAGSQYAVVVANPPDSPRAAVVEIWFKEGGTVQKVPFDSGGTPLPAEPLAPGELRTYRLPRRDVNGTVQAPLAYQIKSSVPIIAYQFNPLENENVFSNDASLLLPATLLGKEYIVMTREQTFDTLRGYLTVVAVMPGETKVAIDVTASTEAGMVYPGGEGEAEIKHLEPGQTAFFTLKQFDVLNIETDSPGADLTGSTIRTDQRVAAFGGSEAANAPNTARCVDIDPATAKGVCEWDRSKSCRDLMDCVSAGFNTCCADHLEQQLFPITTWGTQYIATKSWDRGQERDVWRILAARDNTKIVMVPLQQGVNGPILNKGEWYEFESRQHFEIHSVDDAKPILVGQFLAAQDAPDPNVGGIAQPEDAGTGDPAFMLAIPVEQYRNDFVILVPAEYELNYVNIVAPTGAQVAVDGEDVLPGFFEAIGSGVYSVYRDRLDPGTHTITSSEPAGVIVYGYDQYVSYGYTGGLDLAEINKGLGLPPVDGGTTP
jgi:hypothetical protein